MSSPLADQALDAFGFVDLSTRAKLQFTGADRVRFLNGQISNDARRATVDESIYACVMTIKGKMCADVFVHAETECLVMDTEGELREALAARLERYIIADDVQLEDVTDELALIHLLPLADGNVPTLPAFSTEQQRGLSSASSCRFGFPGWDLFFPTVRREEIHSILADSCREISATDLERRRIAAGVPRWGAELDENTMPAEADLEARAVDYAKGCYIGQEVVSRVKSVGHVNRTLRGLRALSPTVPLATGMLLYPADAPEPRGREVGRITSVAPGNADKPAIALGYVRRGSEIPGTRLEAVAVSLDDQNQAPLAQCPVEVCSLPFSM